ncbi:MAG: hypothetical protein GYB64_08965 [Chloroflexi bacterium]|nr:hypothetical protein [Chloroflexota bacterium]
MKESPFPTWGEFAGALAKALILVAALNTMLLLAGINPVRELVRLNTYGILDDGRDRLTYPSDLPNGQLPVDAQLFAHTIHYTDKGPDEFRVLVLGESGIAGWGLPDEHTFTAQLNDLDVQIEGRQLVAYNLAYPQPSAPRDAIVLDAALRYDPDLVVWFVTAASFNNEPAPVGANRVFFNVNRPRLEALAAQHPDLLGPWMARQGANLLDDPPAWQQIVALTDQDLLPIWFNTLFYPILPPDLGVTDVMIAEEPLPERARYMADHPGYQQMPNLTWDWLRVACRVDVDLLVINRPMWVADDEALYNPLYGRDLYDAYRAAMQAYTAEWGIAYADLWDLLPAQAYTDTALHTDRQGTLRLAEEVAAILETQGTQPCMEPSP